MGALPSADELLAGLTSAQRAAVTSDAAPLCIMAAAGAGKTRVLTRRIAYRCLTGRAEPAHTLAVTFTRKAAGELRERLSGLGLRDGVAAGTFHAHATAQLQRWWADRRQARPTLLDRKTRVLGPIVAGRPGLERAPLADLASAIEWAKARTIAPERFEEALGDRARLLPPGVSPAAVAAVYARYEDEKRRRGLIDFDDLLGRCADALERDPEFAGAQRWRWRHVYVDEFQDLNPLQHRLLLAWLGSSTDLCVVGDPNQAIYGWNGADPALLGRLPERWPSAQVLHLDANHRCTEQIVRAAASVLGPAGLRLSGAGREGPVPVVEAFDSERAEARAVAAAICAAHSEGLPWSAMAVLTRTNAQLTAFSGALSGAGVPWYSAATATLLQDPASRALTVEWRSRAHQPLQAVLADLEESLAGNAGSGGSPDSLRALADAARAFLALSPDASVAEWLDWLPSTDRDRSAGGAGNVVTLSSFHRAKGLEWSRVWVAGVEEGLVPLGRSGSGQAETEERQLLYVALTRAVDVLSVSWSRTRLFGARPVPRQPSRWLEAIEAATADDPAPTPDGPGGGMDTEGWRRRLAEQRSGLRRAAAGRAAVRHHQRPWPEPDAELQGALRAWRLETARYTGVPPNSVLHDSTLEALAALRPGSMEQLLAVPGFGPVKASRYGAPILDILADRAASA